jgi:hypothetical protein
MCVVYVVELDMYAALTGFTELGFIQVLLN